MTEHDDPTRDRLKHHFAQRVIHQARHVLEIWQQLSRSEWTASGMADLREAVLRLQRYAERFEQAEHAQLAAAIGAGLDAVAGNRGRLSSERINEFAQLMLRLSRTGLRHGDQLEHTQLPPLRKPVYLALQDAERAERLAQQLEFFGVHAQLCEHAAAFRAAMAERHPAALLMDVDFAGAGLGLALAEEVQAGLAHKLPVLFFSHEDTDTPTAWPRPAPAARSSSAAPWTPPGCWKRSRCSPASPTTTPSACSSSTTRGPRRRTPRWSSTAPASSPARSPRRCR